MSDKAPEPEARRLLPRGLAHPALGMLGVITLVLVGWALHVMQPVFLPIVFAFFLALLLSPVDARVTSWAGGRAWVGHLAAMTLLALVLAAFMGALWISAQQFLARFPAEQASEAVEQLSGGGDNAGSAEQGDGTAQDVPDEDAEPAEETATGEAAAGATGAAVESAIQATPGAGLNPSDAPDPSQGGAAATGLVEQIRGLAGSGGFGGTLMERASGLATTVISTISAIALALVLIFFLTLLMLSEAPRWYSKLGAMLRPDKRAEVSGAVDLVAEKTRSYLWVRFILGIVTALLYVGWLWIFGLDLLIVWALLTFVFNFVPSIGSLISGILPVVYAFATRDPWTAVMVGAGVLAIEQVMGNYIDPRVQGRHLSISALVILCALLFWGWVWGVAGAILAVPITMVVMVACAHVPGLRWIALGLSDETDYAGVDEQLGAPGEAKTAD
ncbi:AI-2 transport protein TqsA [Limimaricola variabilis]|uniref:AI-2 transport protein TqsA n=1 Tax=Limimaricola variabilis TaxID=1492771 RepID=A0ABR6HMZ9_9RHOB|nr:AI-2E family transporter [Limimaricola variabilis]MBB3711933.1 AI-2 transport protein TqsA [Limimaricola variabilis]